MKTQLYHFVLAISAFKIESTSKLIFDLFSKNFLRLVLIVTSIFIEFTNKQTSVGV